MGKFWRVSLVAIMLTGCDQIAEQEMGDIYGKVAQDAVEQYEITQKHGSDLDKCVQAGMVVAAFLQAKDEEQYRHWKIIENLHCANAGVL